MKATNERCPLQAECERKCAFKGRELQCDYYEVNARDDLVIDDQEEIRLEYWRKRDAEDYERELAELEDDEDETEDDSIQLAGKATRPLETIENEILFFKNQTGAAMLEIGRRLIEAKSQLQHGEWKAWLEEKVEFSVRTAQRFMKIAEGYKESDTVTLLGTRKALALLAFEDSEREEFMAEKHEVNGEEKSVVDMTISELEEAIRRRREAEDELAKVKQEKLDAEARADNFAREAEKARADANIAQTSGKKMGEDMRIIKSQLNDQKNIAATAQAEADELRKELEEIRKKPIEMAVREPSEEEISAAAAAQIEAAKAEIHAQVEEAHAGDEERIRELEKQLAMADPDTAVFKTFFDEWQEAYGKMMDQLAKVEAKDEVKAIKLRSAIRMAKEEMK